MIKGITLRETDRGWRFFAETDDEFNNCNWYGFTTEKKLKNSYSWFVNIYPLKLKGKFRRRKNKQ